MDAIERRLAAIEERMPRWQCPDCGERVHPHFEMGRHLCNGVEKVVPVMYLAQADPPEFSCQPTEIADGYWQPLPAGEIRVPSVPGAERCVYGPIATGCRCIYCDQEPDAQGHPRRCLLRNAGTPFPVPDDVRERARERASLADDAAGPWPGERIDWEAEAARAQMRANRFEESLRALLAILNGGNPLAMIDAADITALIEGCLAGGTITPEGLRQDG